MKTTLELSKFNISIEEDEAGVVKVFVTKDGENIDEMVFDADEYTDTDPKGEEEEEEGDDKIEVADEKESDATEVVVGESMSFDKYFASKEAKK